MRLGWWLVAGLIGIGVAPMLGLVATMIPMGPALKALGDGQLTDVSRSLTGKRGVGKQPKWLPAGEALGWGNRANVRTPSPEPPSRGSRAVPHLSLIHI